VDGLLPVGLCWILGHISGLPAGSLPGRTVCRDLKLLAVSWLEGDLREELLFVVQYPCGAMAATSVGRSVVVVVVVLTEVCLLFKSRRGDHVEVTNTWGEVSMCDTPPTFLIVHVDLVQHFI
jgi:hypothetical protein